jgi:hypothetical protein
MGKFIKGTTCIEIFGRDKNFRNSWITRDNQISEKYATVL